MQVWVSGVEAVGCAGCLGWALQMYAAGTRVAGSAAEKGVKWTQARGWGRNRVWLHGAEVSWSSHRGLEMLEGR